MAMMLESELRVFHENLPAWLPVHDQEFALVGGCELLGFFPTVEAALDEGARRFGLEPFLVRRVEARQPDVFIPALALDILRS